MDYYPHNLEFTIENLQYALSYDPDHHQAVEALLAIKQRPADEGLILIADNYGQLLKYVDDAKIPMVKVFASGISGRFSWDKNCLVFISVDGSKVTPLFPYGLTKWDDASKTLTIEGIAIKMGELIETNGTFFKNLLNREGICCNHPYILSI